MRYMTQHPSSGIWYFRFQIPKPFRRYYANLHELKRSLRSKSYDEAVIMALQYELTIKREMSLIKERYASLTDLDDIESYDEDALELLLRLRTLSDKNIYSAIREIHFLYISPLHKALDGLKSDERLYSAQQYRISISDEAKTDPIQLIKDVFPDYLDPNWRIDKYLERLASLVGKDKYGSIEFEEIRNVLTTFFLLLRLARQSLEVLDIENAELCLTLLNALPDKVKSRQPITIPENLLKQPKIGHSCLTPNTGTDTDKAGAVEDEITYDLLLEGFCTEKINNNVKQSSIKQYIYSMETVHSLLGIKDTQKINRSDVNRVITQLFLYPKDANTDRNAGHFGGLTVPEILEKNRELQLPVISKETVSRYIQRCSSVYKWGLRHKKISYNPFEGAIGRDSGKKYAQKKEKVSKRPFDQSDLVQIFSHKVFITGIPGFNNKEKLRLNYQYWVPLICFYMGLRPQECCQLKIENIKFEDGIMYLDVTDSYELQSLKNVNSVRKVPLHDEILRLGFERYVKSVKSEMLFPELTYNGDSGFYGKLESWFTKHFTVKMQLTKQNKSFYSMRHTFIAFYQRKQIYGPIIKQLTAHANRNVGDDVYGEEFSVSLLKEQLDLFHSDDVCNLVKPWMF